MIVRSLTLQSKFSTAWENVGNNRASTLIFLKFFPTETKKFLENINFKICLYLKLSGDFVYVECKMLTATIPKNCAFSERKFIDSLPKSSRSSLNFSNFASSSLCSNEGAHFNCLGYFRKINIKLVPTKYSLTKQSQKIDAEKVTG